MTELRRSALSFVVGALLIAGSASQVRADGLPGEYLISDQWRILHAFYSPLGNPAFLTEANYTSVRGVLSLAPDDVAQLWEAGLVVPVGLYHSLALTWVAENGLPVTDAYYDAATDQFVEGATSSNMNSLFMASYAVNPWRRLSLGANLKFMYSSNFGTPAAEGGLDVGASYRLLQNPILGYYLLGLSYQNAVSVNFLRGQGNSSQLEAYLHTTHLDNQIEFNVNFDLTDLLASPSSFIDESKKFEWKATGQVGFWIIRIINLMGFLGIDQSNKPQFWGVGLGTNVPGINDGRDLAITYAYRDKFSGGLMGSHSIYARIDLGKHREELYARRMARTLDLSANELYNRALRLFFAKKYWDAYFLFTRIVSEFPDFFKNDWVTYYRGASLENLELRVTSTKAYDDAIGWKSDGGVGPYAHLGKMRINYRDMDYTAVEHEYRELMGGGTPDSLRFHAAYIFGEACINSQRYPEAIQALSLIPETHPAYLFAEHSMAVAYILNNNNTDKAVECLEKAVDYSLATTPAQMDIVARSYLFAGYLFYEQQSLGKAIAALRKVPPNSMYYEDALLGICWCAEKAGQWQDCVTFGQILAQTSSKTVVQCEGLLLKAFGLVMQKSYPQAEDILKATLEKIKTIEVISADSLNVVRNHYESDRVSYETLGDTVVNISRLSESEAKARRVGDLSGRQVNLKEKVDAFPRFVDHYFRLTFFNKNQANVKGDLEYSLVTLQGIVEQHRASKGTEDIGKKQTDIDKEIQKLKDELKTKDSK